MKQWSKMRVTMMKNCARTGKSDGGKREAEKMNQEV